jgi:hypothetical protein
MWTGYPASYTVLWPTTVKRGDRASCQALSCPITVVDSGTSPGDVKPLVLDI